MGIHETEMLAEFRAVAEKYCEQHGEIRSGQGKSNSIAISAKVGFQLGDLRVVTASRHVVVEVEGPNTVHLSNLVKYWWLLEKQPEHPPIALLHVLWPGKGNNLWSQVALWDLLQKHMADMLGEQLQATRYIHPAETSKAVSDFEHWLALD